MNSSLQYLERVHVEETASRLRSEGYLVETPDDASEIGLDLVASKGDRKIAVQVKARPSLKDSARQIGRTRDEARGLGFDEFRLVVVNPPHDREVSVEGLDAELARWIRENPGELASIATRVSVTGFAGTDLDVVSITTDGVRVHGVGSVTVDCEDPASEGRERFAWTTDFPVEFEVVLTHGLTIEGVDKLEVDLSSLDD